MATGAKKTFLAHIDLNKNELRNAVIDLQTSLPSSGVVGQIVFLNANGEKTLYQYNGTNWVRLVDTTYNATTDRKGIVERATDVEASAGTDTERYITPAQLKSVVDAAVAGGMHFIGAATATTTAGVEGTPFNPASKSVGDEYKVIAGTGDNVELTVKTDASNKENAKVGDTVICTDAANNYWVIIPSGDEPSGTVTSVTLTTPTGLKVNNSNSAEITSSGTFALTVDSSHVIPTTTEIKGYSRVTVGSSNADASSANDAITFAAGGDASVSLSGKTVTYTVNDQKVKQTSKTTGEFPLLLSAQATPTSGTAYEAGYDSDVKVNTATGTLTATAFSGDGSALTNVPPASHTHGNISNDGKLTDNVAAPANGDYIVIRDATTAEVQSSNIAFDGSTTGKYLSQKGTWESEHVGTVTSVQVQATSPVQSSTSTASSTTLSTTISLANAYGDTKNPYGNKNANVVLAGPASGNAAAPTFRALVAADIPDISATYMTRYAANNPASTSSTLTGGVFAWVVTHNLGSLDVIVGVRDVASGEEVAVEVVHTDANTITIKMNSTAQSIDSGTYRVVVIG